MRRPHASKPPGLGLDHRAEVVAAVSALLLQVEADCGQVFVADRLGQQGAVARDAERALDGMRGKQGVVAQATQAGAARPPECGGIVGHAGAHRVEVDVADATQQGVVAVDKAGFVASFPECAGAPVACVELADVVATQQLHHPAGRACFGWRGKQVQKGVREEKRGQVHLSRSSRFGRSMRRPDAGEPSGFGGKTGSGWTAPHSTDG